MCRALGLLVEAAEDFGRVVASIPVLEVVRAHLLDQDGKNKLLSKKAARQAGFGDHNDKGEEKVDPAADDVPADETTGGRNSSILFTLVMRLGGENVPSALEVCGYQPAHTDKPGDGHLFPSLLQHRTAVNGGLKVAFFLGFRAPCVAEERMSRYQVW